MGIQNSVAAVENGRTVLQKKLNRELLYDPAILTIGIYQKN